MEQSTNLRNGDTKKKLIEEVRGIVKQVGVQEKINDELRGLIKQKRDSIKKLQDLKAEEEELLRDLKD